MVLRTEKSKEMATVSSWENRLYMSCQENWEVGTKDKDLKLEKSLSGDLNTWLMKI